MEINIPTIENMTIESFIDTFHRIMDWKRQNGWRAFYDNLTYETLFRQAEFYGEEYANNSHGWSCNIWSRSKANTAVVETNDDLRDEHKFLMRSALEYVLTPNPLVKVDGVYGQHESVAFRTPASNGG